MILAPLLALVLGVAPAPSPAVPARSADRLAHRLHFGRQAADGRGVYRHRVPPGQALRRTVERNQPAGRRRRSGHQPQRSRLAARDRAIQAGAGSRVSHRQGRRPPLGRRLCRHPAIGNLSARPRSRGPLPRSHRRSIQSGPASAGPLAARPARGDRRIARRPRGVGCRDFVSWLSDPASAISRRSVRRDVCQPRGGDPRAALRRVSSPWPDRSLFAHQLPGRGRLGLDDPRPGCRRHDAPLACRSDGRRILERSQPARR